MCMHSVTMPVPMCSLCTPVPKAAPVRHARSRRTQGIPTWTQWLAFKATRPLAHVPKCILCLWDLSRFKDLLDADVIRIGCRVKVLEYDSFTVCNVDYEELVGTKIIPMHMTGLGCPVCRALYTKATSTEMARYHAADTQYVSDLTNPSKRDVLLKYGCTGPNKRQPTIDVEELVLQIETRPKVTQASGGSHDARLR